MNQTINPNVAAAGGTLAGISGVLAVLASQRFGIPIEVTGPLVAGAFGWLSHLFARLTPK